MATTLDTRFARFTVRHPRLMPAVMRLARRVQLLAKKRAESRAWCPGASPPDNSCSPSNKGDGGGGGQSPSGGDGSGGASSAGSKVAQAKPGDGPLVKAAREEHKKALAKLRKSVEEAEQKGIDKFMKASQEYFKEKGKHYDIAERAGKLQEEHAILGQRLGENPGDAKVRAAFEETERKMAESFVELEAAESVMSKAQAKREKIRSDMRTATVRALRKEVDAVNKEDGTEPRHRQRVEETLANNAHVAAGMGESYQRTSKEIAARPAVAQELNTAREFAIQAVNPEIHGQAMTTPVRFEENTRAFAHVREWDHDADRIPGAVSDPASRSSSTVLSATDNASTHLHEMAHHVEFSTPEVRELTHDFLESRTRGEEVVPFATKFAGAGYAEDERGSPDDFKKAFIAAGYTEEYADRLAHYTGKRYDGGLTEVLTMGTELMFRDAKAFARADPEWFDLVSGVLSGRILSKTRDRKRKQLPYRDPRNG